MKIGKYYVDETNNYVKLTEQEMIDYLQNVNKNISFYPNDRKAYSIMLMIIEEMQSLISSDLNIKAYDPYRNHKLKKETKPFEF